VKVVLFDGQELEYVPEMIGEGGMKRAYFTVDRKLVVNLYKDQRSSLDPMRQARLHEIIGSDNPTKDPVHGPYFKDLFCWPVAIIVKPQPGVVTPAYQDDFIFNSGPAEGQPKVGLWFSNQELRQQLPATERGEWKGCLSMCAFLARAIRKMHLSGFAHSDLSSRNVLFSPVNGRAMVVDVDSLVVQNIYPPEVLGTPGYIPPEVLSAPEKVATVDSQQPPTTWADLHALGVLIYESLLFRHPLRGPRILGDTAENDELLIMGEQALFIEDEQDQSNRPAALHPTCDSLGPYLQPLMMRCFQKGLHQPAARPSAVEWEDALCRTEDLLIKCGNHDCPEKWFIYLGDQRPVCPWCGWSLESPILLLDFFTPTRRGHYLPEDHSLVAWNRDDENPIHAWHINSCQLNVEGADQSVQASVRFVDGCWMLTNLMDDVVIRVSGKPLHPGQRMAVADGDQVTISGVEMARLFRVKMIG